MCGCVAGDRMRVTEKKTNTVQYGKLLEVQTRRYTGTFVMQDFTIETDSGELIDMTLSYMDGKPELGNPYLLDKVNVPETVSA